MKIIEPKICDHGTPIETRCEYCVIAFSMTYRPRHTERIGPDVLGTCDECNEDQPLKGGHLYRMSNGDYLCAECYDTPRDCSRLLK